MARPVAVGFEHVESAVRALRASGVPVGWANGRVRGLAAVRRTTGGDGGRVRAMTVLVLDREGAGVGRDELRRARATLGRADAMDRAVRPLGSGDAAVRAAAREIAEAVAEVLLRARPAAAGAIGFPEPPAGSRPDLGGEDEMHACQPAGTGSPTGVGAAENPPTNGAGGGLGAARTLGVRPIRRSHLGAGRAPAPACERII